MEPPPSRGFFRVHKAVSDMLTIILAAIGTILIAAALGYWHGRNGKNS